MNVFRNNNNISVSIKINGIKVNEFNTRVNECMVSPNAVIGCFNNIPDCCDTMTEELVGNMKKVLAISTVKELLHQGKIEKILLDAESAYEETALELEKLKELLPFVERTQDPITDEIEKAYLDRYKPYKTYTEVLSSIYASNFVDLGIMKFEARKGH